jgi:hypothetical protein
MFLKELESWLERGQNVPFLREICPRKKCTPNIGAITGILLNFGWMKRRKNYSIQKVPVRTCRVCAGFVQARSHRHILIGTFSERVSYSMKNVPVRIFCS